MGGLGNAGVRTEHNEHWQGLVDKHSVDMNGTRQRFKHGIALILNQRGQVTSADRQQPSWGENKDGELTASPPVERNLTQRSSLYGPGHLTNYTAD